ncbi:MAG: hypothetical protein R3B09_22760 [Nannocystaceae bacterium]
MADDRPLPVPDSAPGATLRLTVLGETDSPLDAEAEEPEKIGA